MRLQVSEIVEELEKGIKGEVKVFGDKNIQISELLIDSRSLTWPEETLFFALSTSRNDGHKYIETLYNSGVRAFVVTQWPETLHRDACYILVPNVLDALQTIGHYAGTRLHGELVAITGSRGKTTLKEWIFQLMEPLAEIVRSPRSYNSQIGVPLSLWQIGDTTSLAIIEAGISREKEMERLAAMIDPDTVIFTNLDDEHSEGFPSLSRKGAEKALLASPKNVKKIIYCADSEEVAKALAPYGKGREVWRWTRDGSEAEVVIECVTELGDSSVMTWRCGEKSGKVSLPGCSEADIDNGANALTYMLSHGISAEVIRERFSILCTVGTRLDVTEGVNGCSLIYDSYTSDFSSLGPALDFMRRRPNKGLSHTVIISDMRHEGGEMDVYARISNLFRSTGVNRVIGIGPALSRHAALFGSDARFFQSTEDFLKEMSPSDFSSELILLKGAPGFTFSKIREMLEARTHETVLEVNLDALVRNFNYFRSCLPSATGLIAMVKASGYGAGSFEIAKTLQDAGAAYLAVAVLDEGIDLRRNGITMPIMVMNPKVVNYKQMFAYRLEPEIYSRDMLEDVIREAQKNGIKEYPVHIKLDTGMHRMGFIEDELPELMERLESQNNIVARSVFSHLATADCVDMDDYTGLQLDRFRRYTDYMLQHSSRPILRHVLNSAGILRFPEHHYDMARLGIGLYGVRTLPEDIEKPLSTVSSLRTVIIAIREWEAGETIGYGRRGELHRKSKIATIPIGYADGMNRHFGRGAITVKINGHDAPTVGNICMDACMIDVTDVDCKVGDAVEIFGPSADVQRLADVLDTIPYEVLTSVSPRVKRVYYRE
ncbi:MAG: bifunctional UDP-N-acetylmuramoyl-tripeptide:D-alanyl-D-alanine ligase/alanine racemase [Prevotella sp.]|nr:bifunctional UDP-N-acetylmuramoyl-tripeptide:D-alanyl-D-alanine ligase/alanine racemase [Bacteroides sp.]MCM1366207.1 bifunctional UDP-N-acetylmuramoyl-tripeptide:D-alanyl-D-alanine ligase/alanine racemase [Prevotella sp.]MCM1436959.1 bifunctional UDP-N-acetylmuramoyl-tripeptide:D-alanyl-D-alanine ligase/alanine racemase [Prevotella sp.]